MNEQNKMSYEKIILGYYANVGNPLVPCFNNRQQYTVWRDMWKQEYARVSHMLKLCRKHLALSSYLKLKPSDKAPVYARDADCLDLTSEDRDDIRLELEQSEPLVTHFVQFSPGAMKDGLSELASCLLIARHVSKLRSEEQFQKAKKLREERGIKPWPLQPCVDKVKEM